MSFDIYLLSRCDHLIYREMGLLDLDHRTIFMQYPVSSISSIEVYASDSLVSNFMYTLIDNLTTYEGVKSIYFNNLWKTPNDYFEVSYTTFSNFCVKCGNSNFLDDLSYDVKGDISEIRDERLLMQNVEKFVVTQINSNPFHTYIGTGLVGLLGSRVMNINFIISQVTSEINRTLQKFQELQTQYQQAGRAVSKGEMLATVNDVAVTSDPNDPTILRANVAVTAQSGKTVEFSQFLRLRA